jgi:hypothetical protein
MTAKLYAMPASHPTMAAALMLERKRISYRVPGFPGDLGGTRGGAG